MSAPSPEGGWDVAAWIQAAASIASAYYALRSAVAARTATVVAAQALNDQRSGAKLARRELYYRALIADPALAAIGPFVKDTSLAVDRALQASSNHTDQLALGQSLIGSAAADPFAEFEARYYDLRDTVLTRVQLWGVHAYIEQVTNILDDMVDEATVGLEQAARGSHNMLKPILERHTARLVHLIWQHDPGAQGTTLQVPVAPVRRPFNHFIK